MSTPELKYQKYNIYFAKLLNLIIDLDEEQQRSLLQEVEEKYLKEKRGNNRKACRVPVRYINKDRICSSFMTNLSRDGCFIETEDPLLVGDEILMDVGFDSQNKAFRIKGVVAHVNRMGVGIKYKEMIMIKSKD
jgi:Tfp pilus assembly protein PilZ